MNRQIVNYLTMVKIYILIITAFVMPADFTDASDRVDWANLNPLTVFKAISVFESDPGGPDGASAISIIYNFARASRNVDVAIDSVFFPWLKRKPVINNAEVLLGAFVAGNIRPQLERQVNQDHPVDGFIFMCKIYTILRGRGQIEKVPELEKWTRLDREGIKRLIEQIQSMKEQQPSPPAPAESEGVSSDSHQPQPSP